LKRGKGSGGSPTQYEVIEQEKALKFEKRHPSIVSYRKRKAAGDYESYSMIGGESM
jgi:hypothetical protein